MRSTRSSAVLLIIFGLSAICLAQLAPTGFQGTGPLLGQAEKIAPPPMKVRWQYKTSDEDRAPVTGSPVIADGVAYIADGKGVLHAVDLKTGTARWTYTGGDPFETTPLVYDGKVFLGDVNGRFHAVSVQSGKKVWMIDAEAPIHSSANVAEGGRIIFGTDGAEIFCISAADGKEQWRGKAGDRVNASPSVGGGLAFVSGCDAHLRGFDVISGQEKFAVELPALAPGSAAYARDRLVVGTDAANIVCVSADGKRTLWTYKGVAESAMVYASPAVADGIAVVGARDRQVHAINIETGQGAWTFKTRGDVDAPALISDGRVYVPSKDKRLYVLELKTGKKLWEFAMPRAIEAGPAVAAGVVVIADSGGNVTCLEPGQ
jgi:outer membrane protein assembly factor BamB